MLVCVCVGVCVCVRVRLCLLCVCVCVTILAQVIRHESQVQMCPVCARAAPPAAMALEGGGVVCL